MLEVTAEIWLSGVVPEGGSPVFQLLPLPPVMMAALLSPALRSGDLEPGAARSRQRLDTEKSLHFPLESVVVAPAPAPDPVFGAAAPAVDVGVEMSMLVIETNRKFPRGENAESPAASTGPTSCPHFGGIEKLFNRCML